MRHIYTDPLGTAPDIIFDNCILVFIVAAYWPQIATLRNEKSAVGLSSFHVIFSVLLSNVQMSWAMILMPLTWPNSRDPSDKSRSPHPEPFEIIGGLLGYLQVAVQWFAMVQVLFAFAAAQNNRWFARFLKTVWVAHTILTVLPTSLLWLMNTRGESMADRIEVGILVGLLGEAASMTAPILLVLQLISQLWRCRRRSADPGALNLVSVSLQVVAYGLLSFRWSLRAGIMPWQEHRQEISDIGQAYVQGFLPLNYLMMSGSCVLLLLAYCRSFAWRVPKAERGKRVVVTWPRPYKGDDLLQSPEHYEDFDDKPEKE